MTKGPRRPHLGRPPSSAEPKPSDIFKPFRYRVTGEGVARASDPEHRRRVLALAAPLAEVGLHLHTQDLDADDPDRPRLNRFATRMISLDVVVSHIMDSPGKTREELVEDIYRAEPWSPQAKAAADRRLMTSLRRVAASSSSALRIVYDERGVRRYHPGPEAQAFVNDHIRSLGPRLLSG